MTTLVYRITVCLNKSGLRISATKMYFILFLLSIVIIITFLSLSLKNHIAIARNRNNSRPVQLSGIQTLLALDYKVHVQGDFWTRLRRLNEALCELRSRTWPENITLPWQKVSYSNITVIGKNYKTFMHQLAKFHNVMTLYLPYQLPSNLERHATWSSFNDTSNLLIQSYYAWTGDSHFCNWSSGCVHINDTRLRIPLDARFLKWRGSTDEHFHGSHVLSAGKIYGIPLFATFYVHIIRNAVVSDVGNIITSSFKYVPFSCRPDFSKSVPRSILRTPIYDEVFVTSQFWGYGVFHRMIEVVPRIATFIEFLHKNAEIQIHVPQTGGRLAELLRILNLKSSRLVRGNVRAKLAYVPPVTGCGAANIRETQILNFMYRSYVDKKIPDTKRNRIILIRRSSSRKFTQQNAIEAVVRNAARDFGLTYSLFIDNPTPSLHATMKWFKAAVMVIGSHGAGLSNIIFSDPGTYVIEGLCSPPDVRLCYRHMAHVLGHHWYGILGRRGGCRVVDVAASTVDYAIREHLMMDLEK